MRIPFRMLPARSKPFDVVGLGLNSIDFLTVVTDYPAPNTKQRLERFSRQPGGQIATALRTCARLGCTARYLGRFGDDELGVLARACLESAGIDLSEARTVAGATNQFAVVLVDARSGDRTVLWDRHRGLQMHGADVPEAAATSGRMLLVDCHETEAATQAARYARAASIPTVADVEKVRPGIADFLHEIDAIIAAQDFPSALTGYEDLGRALQAIAREFGAPLVTVTLGKDGSLTWCGGQEIRTPAFPIACVDSTGAGDVFRGGFLAGCLRMTDASIEEVLTYASAAAALNCRRLGAGAGIPDTEEIEQFLRTAGSNFSGAGRSKLSEAGQG